jgi:hypothetical protein
MVALQKIKLLYDPTLLLFMYSSELNEGLKKYLYLLALLT